MNKPITAYKGDNLESAIGQFREAATIDPEFALAYANTPKTGSLPDPALMPG